MEKHIAAWVNIGGCMLGVPKAMAAFMSGEVLELGIPIGDLQSTECISCFAIDARYGRAQPCWSLLAGKAILQARESKTLPDLGRISFDVAERR